MHIDEIQYLKIVLTKLWANYANTEPVRFEYSWIMDVKWLDVELGCVGGQRIVVLFAQLQSDCNLLQVRTKAPFMLGWIPSGSSWLVCTRHSSFFRSNETDSNVQCVRVFTANLSTDCLDKLTHSVVITVHSFTDVKPLSSVSPTI